MGDRKAPTPPPTDQVRLNPTPDLRAWLRRWADCDFTSFTRMTARELDFRERVIREILAPPEAERVTGQQPVRITCPTDEQQCEHPRCLLDDYGDPECRNRLQAARAPIEQPVAGSVPIPLASLDWRDARGRE